MAAEPFDCTNCQRTIGARANHIIVDTTVICVRCAHKPATHAAMFPDCEKQWHNIIHHRPLFTNRTGLRRWLDDAEDYPI